MFNKKLIILLLLAIFCIGITITSVSANDTNSNGTDQYLTNSQNNNEQINLNENYEYNNFLSETNADKLSYGTIEGIDTENYDKYDNPEKLSVRIYSNGGVSVYYTIFDSNGEIKYDDEMIQSGTHPYVTSHFSFESNYDVFKNLSDGDYRCSLSTSKILNINSINKAKIAWNVTKLTPQKITNDSINAYSSTTSQTSKSNHYTKYIKVGKYKVPVWSDDSKNTQKNKVIKYLKKHVKKGHKFKIHGYKFKVSTKNYRKILYYKKYGYDGKMGAAPFKAKTNKYYTIKKPIYKTKKITKKVWKYKKVLQSEYWNWDGGSEWQDYNTWEKYVKKGWTWYGTSDKEKTYSDYSYYSAHYYKLKKKVKTTINKKTIVGYKKVKVRVYAWSVESQFKVGVQFRAGGQGHNQPITGYYFF